MFWGRLIKKGACYRINSAPNLKFCHLSPKFSRMCFYWSGMTLNSRFRHVNIGQWTLRALQLTTVCGFLCRISWRAVKALFDCAGQMRQICLDCRGSTGTCITVIWVQMSEPEAACCVSHLFHWDVLGTAYTCSHSIYYMSTSYLWNLTLRKLHWPVASRKKNECPTKNLYWNNWKC